MDDDLFPVPILVIPVFILLIYFIIMDGISPDTIFLVIIPVSVMIFIASWAGFYKIFLKRKLEDHDKNRKNHEEKVVGIIGRFVNIKIEYLFNREFGVLLQVLDDLKNKKSYRWALQHLKSYEVIWDKWKAFEEANKKLKIRLNELKDCMFNKISKELGEEYKKCLSYPLWVIIKYAIEGNVKSINIEMNEESGGRYLRVGLTGRPAVSIHLKGYNMNKIKKFLIALQKDNDFNHKIVFLLGAHKTLNDIIRQIANELNMLLEDIDNKFELKGRCDGCPTFRKS